MSHSVQMKHIDASRLEEDLQYRFEYVSSFVGFGKDDIETLHAAAPLVSPLVPHVVDAVYDKLFSYDITKAYFVLRNEGFHGRLASSADTLDQSNDQIKFRKDMLSKYLVKLVTAPYDANTVKYLDWVGKIHTDKAGSKSISVDYVHVNALFGYVEDILIDAILKLEIDSNTKKAAVRAINKLLWVQNDLFTRHYITKAEKKPEPSTLANMTTKSLTIISGLLIAGVAAVVGIVRVSSK